MIYAVPSDRPDRYDEVLPAILTSAAQIDSVFDDSAALPANGGGSRHIRFVTTPDCYVKVEKLHVAANADDNFTNTVAALTAANQTDSNRKYLVYMDSETICGIGQIFADDDPLPADNANDGGVPGLIARVDTSCWLTGTGSVAAHELVHTMGGVQWGGG